MLCTKHAVYRPWEPTMSITDWAVAWSHKAYHPPLPQGMSSPLTRHATTPARYSMQYYPLCKVFPRRAKPGALQGDIAPCEAQFIWSRHALMYDRCHVLMHNQWLCLAPPRGCSMRHTAVQATQVAGTLGGDWPLAQWAAGQARS